MVEKQGSHESNHNLSIFNKEDVKTAKTAIRIMEEWLALDIEKQATDGAVHAFYLACEAFMDLLEKTGNHKFDDIRPKYESELAKFKELQTIKHPDVIDQLKYQPEESAFSPHMMQSLLASEELVEAQLISRMFEFQKLAKKLLAKLEAQYEDEQAEFNDMAVGSAVAPFIEGFRRALDGALAIIPGRKSTDQSQDN